MSIEDVKCIVRVSTNEGGSCKHCDHSVGIEHFVDGVNHYISAHGYRLLHVGTQSLSDTDGKTYHTTIAVLGTDEPPPEKEPVVVTITRFDRGL